jgi:hypothetical protein
MCVEENELDKAQTKLAKGLVQITSADASKPCYPEGHLLDHRFMLAIFSFEFDWREVSE